MPATAAGAWERPLYPTSPPPLPAASAVAAHPSPGLHHACDDARGGLPGGALLLHSGGPGGRALSHVRGGRTYSSWAAMAAAVDSDGPLALLKEGQLVRRGEGGVRAAPCFSRGVSVVPAAARLSLI